MKKTTLIVIVFSAWLLIGSTSFIELVDAKGHPRPQQWTVMVYMDGDTNDGVEGAALRNMEEISMAAWNTNYIKVVVLIDRTTAWEDGQGAANTRKYEIRPNQQILLEDCGELNMGNPNTLSNFVTWSIDNYPALRYALILMDHGNAWNGVCRDYTSNNDLLTLDDLDTALSSVGMTIDLIGFDACIMQYLEVAWQIRNYVTVMVASEDVGRFNSDLDYTGCWPYDDIIEHLGDTPGIDAEGLGTLIVNDYRDFYLNATWLPFHDVTISAIRLSDMHYATTHFELLAQCLITFLPDYRTEIEICRDNVENFSVHWVPSALRYIDLYDFLEQLEQSDLPWIRAFYRPLLSLKGDIESTIISEWHDSEHLRASGLGIYFPYSQGHYSYGYANIDFSADYFGRAPSWNSFIQEYLGL